MTKRHHLVPRYAQPGQENANTITFARDATHVQYVRMTHNPVVDAKTSTFYTLTKGQHETVPRCLYVSFNGTVVYDPERNQDNETVDGTKYFELELTTMRANGIVSTMLIKLYITVDDDTPVPEDPEEHPSNGTDQGELDTRPADNNTVGVTVYPGFHATGDELLPLSGLINTTDEEAKAFAFAYADTINVHPNSHKPGASPTTTPVQHSELLNGNVVDIVYTTKANPTLYHLNQHIGALTFIGDYASIPLTGDTVPVQIRQMYADDTTKKVYTVVNQTNVSVTREAALDTEGRDTEDAKNHAANHITSVDTHRPHLPWWILLLTAIGLVVFLAMISYFVMNRK